MFVDKLKKGMKSSHSILLICSEAMKAYLDDGANSGNNRLGDDERNVLLDGFVKYREKLLLVTITDNGGIYIPKDLVQPGEPINGIKDLPTLLDKIKIIYQTQR